jgi:hypothetical protein
MLIENQAAWVKKLGKLKTAYYDAGKIGLFTNTPTITRNTVLADLTEATFVGYAQVTLTTFGAAFLDPSGNYADIVAPLAQFTMTATTTLQTITGYFLLDKDGIYVGAELLPAPIPLTSVGQTISILLAATQGAIAA